jgi:site-specific recombinase XerD
MVYKREGRPSHYFEGKTRHGWKSVCTYTSDKKLAQRIEHMWAELAHTHRAWDLLEPVIADGRLIGTLYDRWLETKQNVSALRRLAADVNLEPLVDEWVSVMKTQVSADWASHAEKHVRHFFPAGDARMVSQVTTEWLTTSLAAYPGKRNTRRKVHSSLSVFFDHPSVAKLFPANPMLQVTRPKIERSPIAFYDAVTVTRIINWQSSPDRQAILALIYGTGADVSPAVAVEREDINPATKEVRIRGTKTAYRDRVVRINDERWPTFWKHAKTVLSGRIFPKEWNRWTVSDWHRHAVSEGRRATKTKSNPKPEIVEVGLKLSKRIPLRKARHHFAVRLLESGAAIRVVAEQLGSDERTVLDRYGPWITSSDDRARAEKMAKAHETKKRSAK